MVTSKRDSGKTPEQRKRQHWMGIARSVVMLIGLIVLTVFITRRPGEPEVISVTPARALDADYRPVDPTTTFLPDETFYISVELRGYRSGTELVAQWRYGGEVFDQTSLIASDAGEGYAGFSLSPQDPPEWPVGTYLVDILYEDHLLGRASFEVTGR
jgi:hypothetical protein